MSLKGQTALIIDDDPDIVNLVSKILENMGLRPVMADTIEVAEEQVQSRTPGIIILDINLNGKNGLNFLTSLKNNKKYKNIPVIVLTALTHPKHEESAMKLGAFKFLRKPIGAPELTMIIKQAEKLFKNLQKIKTFDDDHLSLDIEFKADITQINEIGFLMISPIRFEPQQTISVNSEFFDSIGTSDCIHRIVADLGPNEGGFRTRLSFVGIHESSAVNIRKLKGN